MEKDEVINIFRGIIKGSSVVPNEAIPDKVYKLFEHIPKEMLIRGLVVQDRNRGYSFRELSKRYGVTERTIAYICRDVQTRIVQQHKKYKF